MDYLDTDEMSKRLIFKHFNSFSTLLNRGAKDAGKEAGKDAKPSKDAKKSAVKVGVIDPKKLEKIAVADPSRYIRDFVD